MQCNLSISLRPQHLIVHTSHLFRTQDPTDFYWRHPDCHLMSWIYRGAWWAAVMNLNCGRHELLWIGKLLRYCKLKKLFSCKNLWVVFFNPVLRLLLCTRQPMKPNITLNKIRRKGLVVFRQFNEWILHIISFYLKCTRVIKQGTVRESTYSQFTQHHVLTTRACWTNSFICPTCQRRLSAELWKCIIILHN